MNTTPELATQSQEAPQQEMVADALPRVAASDAVAPSSFIVIEVEGQSQEDPHLIAATTRMWLHTVQEAKVIVHEPKPYVAKVVVLASGGVINSAQASHKAVQVEVFDFDDDDCGTMQDEVDEASFDCEHDVWPKE